MGPRTGGCVSFEAKLSSCQTSTIQSKFVELLGNVSLRLPLFYKRFLLSRWNQQHRLEQAATYLLLIERQAAGDCFQVLVLVGADLNLKLELALTGQSFWLCLCLFWSSLGESLFGIYAHRSVEGAYIYITVCLLIQIEQVNNGMCVVFSSRRWFCIQPQHNKLKRFDSDDS